METYKSTFCEIEAIKIGEGTIPERWICMIKATWLLKELTLYRAYYDGDYLVKYEDNTFNIVIEKNFKTQYTKL